MARLRLWVWRGTAVGLRRFDCGDPGPKFVFIERLLLHKICFHVKRWVRVCTFERDGTVLP